MKKVITAIAPLNISVIKYWGNKDDDLIIPLNDSISVTLSTKHLKTKTTIVLSDEFSENKFWLNGQQLDFNSQTRLLRVLYFVKKFANGKWLENQYVHICSENYFPTGVGLSSSSAGFACLVYAICSLFSINNKKIMSSLARVGSGDACRSIYGGFVHWKSDNKHDDSDSDTRMDYDGDDEQNEDCNIESILMKSRPKPISSDSKFPDIRVIILICRDYKKTTTNLAAMKLSKETSEILQSRIEKFVPKRIEEMIEAIKETDFQKFAHLTMKDSNQFNSVLQDTFPPICYTNDISKSVVECIHYLNEKVFEKYVAAYTFNTGPNPIIFCLKEYAAVICDCFQYLYATVPAPAPEGDLIEMSGIKIRDLLNERKPLPIPIQRKLMDYVSERSRKIPGAIKLIITARIGHGPEIVSKNFSDQECLLDSNGNPQNSQLLNDI